MSIAIYIEPIANGEELVKKLLQDEFSINEINAGILFTNLVKPHFDNFKDNTFILAETNYVDKAYRDSYYHYYSHTTFMISSYDNKDKQNRSYQS